STFAHIEHLRKKSHAPSVKINPVDASRYGIKDNDDVEVFNDQGSCILKAVVCEDVKEGVLISRGLYWAFDYINKQPINALTSDKTSDIGRGCIFFNGGKIRKALATFFCCKISKNCILIVR
ncbi:MAG TPA: hypothetical protein ENM99_03780, partial [Desulfurella acetivorans]|nr:hypothetical protein [Desulfurella acetivorans]